jgi:hypothetical protein
LAFRKPYRLYPLRFRHKGADNNTTYLGTAPACELGGVLAGGRNDRSGSVGEPVNGTRQAPNRTAAKPTQWISLYEARYGR